MIVASERIIQDPSNAFPLGNWLVALLFLLSFGASSVGAGGLVKLGYPIIATCLAVVLAIRDPASYVRLLLWSVFVTPGLRHYVEWHIGYSQSDPIMLASYLIVFASLPSILLHLLNGRRYTVEFLTLILLVLAGLGGALVSGDVVGPLLTAVQWLVPPLLGVYLCSQVASLARIRQSVLSTFMLGLPIISLYAIIQFVDIQPWDVYYMTMAPIDSIGYPVPFMVRVFGMSNAPGVLAATLSTGMLLVLPRLSGFRWIVVLLGVGVLLLTTQRAALGAFTLSITILLLLGRNRQLKLQVVKTVVGIVLVASLLFCIPQAARKIEAITNSVSNLQQDGSARERWEQYESVFALLDADIIGRGLGWQTNSTYINVGSSVAVDSGLIDIAVSLGVIGGTTFLFVLSRLLAEGYALSRRDPSYAAEFSGAIFGLAQLPTGSMQSGEPGIFIFLCLGLLLARSILLNGGSASNQSKRIGWAQSRTDLPACQECDLLRSDASAVTNARSSSWSHLPLETR